MLFFYLKVDRRRLVLQATLNESPFGLSMLTDQIFSFNFFNYLF